MPPTSARAGGQAVPLDPRHLRRVEVTYLGFDRRTHRGALIVNEDLAAEVVAIFGQLLQLHYPIEKIRTVDNYPAANDELSMEDNNTSAFNCRAIPGTDRWSPHAFGRAIDLNLGSTPTSTGRVPSNPTTRRHTWTATAQIRTLACG